MHDELELPPRVVIVMSDQWRRALLRAALREVGYDAIGTRGFREAALIRRSAPDRGPVRLLVVDQDTLGREDVQLFLSQRERLGNPEVILLARATVAPPDGPWRAVLRRPFSVADVVHTVRQMIPLTASHELDLPDR